MSMRMLIDAAHPEETRVVVAKGNQIEEFDFESTAKKQLKGNIYLGRVTRVEPSLQAAFVEFGGNRHGFLAFSEIHPDYYRIPVADRQKLIEQEAEVAAARESADAAADEADSGNADANGNDAQVESLGTNDEIEEEVRAAPRIERRYKIQEVIKRRQVLLVQVVKEERGTKGAALTTYLSLAGRYCVLMPNSPRGGGISRKISNAADRRMLRGVLESLDVPQGMGVIIRTAGVERAKTSIKRDFEYLMRLWENICELTLQSTAPALIYEEGNLIKRAIRDLYTKEIEEILVEGDEGYRTAKNFMRLIMPSHARKVQPYRDRIPLFHRFQVESQLDTMFNPTVRLKSGGYIVINPTEALVAIDVNSGRATREANIEQTALKTNLEAAEEIARQLRLRDLAGLIVIDFIDMEENRSNRAVERRLKECLKNDRARLQVGRISPFGMLEMSRQRLHPGLLEASTVVCPACDGAGIIRSTPSTALHILRLAEDEGIRQRSSKYEVRVPPEVATYVLNEKRRQLAEIEDRYGFHIVITGDEDLIAGQIETERTGRGEDGGETQAVTAEAAYPEAAANGEDSTGKRRRRRRKPRRRTDEAEAEVVEAAAAASEESAAPEAEAEAGETRPSGSRRRRGRRGGRRRAAAAEAAPPEAGPETGADEAVTIAEEAPATDDTAVAELVPGEPEAAQAAEPAETEAAAETQAATDDGAKKPKKKAAAKRKPARRRSKAKPKAAAAEPTPEDAPEDKPLADEVDDTEPAKTAAAAPPPEAKAKPATRPKRRRTRAKKTVPDSDGPPSEAEPDTASEGGKPSEDTSSGSGDEDERDVPAVAAAAPAVDVSSLASATPDVAADAVAGAESEAKPRRRGWWQRRAT